MLSLQECLENIKNAVLGRDVRQSIHDGIKGINDESKADMEAKQTAIEKYTKRQDGVISDYTGKMDLLNSKYEEQIKNMTLASPSDAEIVDSRRTKDNTVFSTLKERLDEDKNSIWIQKQLTSVATLDETRLLKINIPANCVLDKDTLSITPVYKNGDGDALTGSAFTKIEKGEKLKFTIEKVYFDSLCYDVLEDQGVQGGTMGTLEFPVDLNVKVSYLSPTTTKVNQFIGAPEELTTTSNNSLVSSINECYAKINENYQYFNNIITKVRGEWRNITGYCNFTPFVDVKYQTILAKYDALMGYLWMNVFFEFSTNALASASSTLISQAKLIELFQIDKKGSGNVKIVICDGVASYGTTTNGSSVTTEQVYGRLHVNFYNGLYVSFDNYDTKSRKVNINYCFAVPF
jgi:hypothetical protein|nr:MAG TPA: Minor structural protein adsorption, WTA interaction, caudovirales.2A [Caudoviricetes sp.]